ncbi:MAG TPA: CocE/NonD family hydrolase [Bacteroidota bacterium]|nr:CocE/NonD family hydrolase [Bacteroidota bacterium]
MKLLLAALLPLFLGEFAGAQTQHDTTLVTSDGAQLDATYFVPPVPAPKNPAIIFIHGYGLDKFSTMPSCSTFALGGYVTLTYSVRGHGNSTGGSTIMGPREREDFHEVLAYLRSFPNVDTSNIGISGGSQGGLHGLWAAADRLPVQAITSDVIVPDWATNMLQNGCIRRTLLLLLQAGTVHYDPERDTLWDLVRHDDYETFQQRFVPGRDVDTAALNSSVIPQLRLNKWQDQYFTAQDGIEAFLRSVGTKKIYVGSRGHFSDQVESERVYQYDQVSRWLGYFLKNQHNGILGESPVTYAYSSLPMDTSGFFLWTRVGTDTWPPAGVQPVRFYLNADSTLSYSPPAASSDSMILHNRYLNPSYTFDTAYIEGFRGPRFDAALPRQALVYTSPPLGADVVWAGVPNMNFYFSSTDSTFPAHVQIYEVDSANTKYFVNRINFTARHWTPDAASSIEVNGVPHAHKFMKGNKIRIEVTNIDVTNRLLWGEYPFVVPMFREANVAISMDAVHSSYVELPMIGSPLSVGTGPQEIPQRTQLMPNYPNPFNPSTIIRYWVAGLPDAQAGISGQRTSAQFITLKIYDILGREVASLVNEIQSPGYKSVDWDAAGMPGGVYFYRLQAGGTTVTKKMLLIK